MVRLSEYLEIVDVKQKKVIRCRKCGHIFCSATENPKTHASVIETKLSDKKAGPYFPDPSPQLKHVENFILKEYVCPSCVTLFTSEIEEKGSPITPW